MPSKTGIVFISLFAAGCIATLVRTPFYGVLLYEVQYFFNPPARWWYGDLPVLRYSFIIVALIVVSYLLRMDQFKNNRLFDAPQVKWLVAMTVIVALGFSWAVWPKVHTEFFIRYLKVLVFALLAYKVVDTPKKMDWLLLVYILGLFYISWVGWQTGRSGGGRLEGIGGADTTEVNGTAATMVTAVPLIVFYLLYSRKLIFKGMALVALAFVLNCLILLNSRGAFLGLVVAGAYFVFRIFREKVQPHVKRQVVFGIIVGACLFLYLTDAVFWTRMSTLENVNPETGSGHRIELWLKTFDMLKDHPLGAGARGYHYLSHLYLPKEWLSGGMRAVHSTWFEVLSEYGYQGLIVFLGYVLSSFFLLRRVRARLREQDDIYHIVQATALESSYLGLLVAGSFINFFYAELTYWLPLYIAAFANIHLFIPLREEQGKELPVLGRWNNG